MENYSALKDDRHTEDAVRQENVNMKSCQVGKSRPCQQAHGAHHAEQHTLVMTGSGLAHIRHRLSSSPPVFRMTETKVLCLTLGD